MSEFRSTNIRSDEASCCENQQFSPDAQRVGRELLGLALVAWGFSNRSFFGGGAVLGGALLLHRGISSLMQPADEASTCNERKGRQANNPAEEVGSFSLRSELSPFQAPTPAPLTEVPNRPTTTVQPRSGDLDSFDDEIDEASRESFPASDPPAWNHTSASH